VRVLVLLLFGLCALPANGMSVYWGGVSFSDWTNRELNYPNLASMMCSGTCSGGHLNQWALEALDQASFDYFDVSMDYINGREIEGVIMTPMINAETVSAYQDVTGDQTSYIHVYRIYASVIFFEFGTKRFISARPVVLQYTDTLPNEASEAEIKQNFRRLVEVGIAQSNLFTELFQKAKSTKPFTFSQKYARISDLQVSDSALSALGSMDRVDVWADQVKRQFEAFLIDATDAPLVPSMSTSEMTQEFVATFADASVTIKMPEEVPFNINVTVDNLRKIEQADRRQKTLCHAVALRLEIDGLLSQIFNERLVRGRESCSVMTIDKQPDDGYYFTLSLLSLLKQASEQFGETPNKDFIARAIPDNPKAHQNFVRAWESAFKPEL